MYTVQQYCTYTARPVNDLLSCPSGTFIDEDWLAALLIAGTTGAALNAAIDRIYRELIATDSADTSWPTWSRHFPEQTHAVVLAGIVPKRMRPAGCYEIEAMAQLATILNARDQQLISLCDGLGPPPAFCSSQSRAARLTLWTKNLVAPGPPTGADAVHTAAYVAAFKDQPNAASCVPDLTISAFSLNIRDFLRRNEANTERFFEGKTVDDITEIIDTYFRALATAGHIIIADKIVPAVLARACTSLFNQLIDTQHGPKLATMLVLGQFLNVLMDLLAVQLSTMRANFRALPSDTFVPLVLKAMPFEIVQQHWADPDHSEGALASPPIDSYDLTCPPRWQHTQARIAELFKRSSSFSPLAGDLAKHWYQSMKAFDGLGSVVILDSEFAAFSGPFGGKSFYIVPQYHNVAYSSKSVAFQNNQFYALVSQECVIDDGSTIYEREALNLLQANFVAMAHLRPTPTAAILPNHVWPGFTRQQHSQPFQQHAQTLQPIQQSQQPQQQQQQ